MKKLLLLAAFGVAGLVSAKSSVATDLKRMILLLKNQVSQNY